jgi:hypothetical protein
VYRDGVTKDVTSDEWGATAGPGGVAAEVRARGDETLDEAESHVSLPKPAK